MSDDAPFVAIGGLILVGAIAYLVRGVRAARVESRRRFSEGSARGETAARNWRNLRLGAAGLVSIALGIACAFVLPKQVDGMDASNVPTILALLFAAAGVGCLVVAGRSEESALDVVVLRGEVTSPWQRDETLERLAHWLRAHRYQPVGPDALRFRRARVGAGEAPPDVPCEVRFDLAGGATTTEVRASWWLDTRTMTPGFGSMSMEPFLQRTSYFTAQQDALFAALLAPRSPATIPASAPST
ncbi:MAG: hypothetical protein HY275_09030 [Gemmatimonadetes bacterium]|nr:hypothetical protein [Gemmatimonadota bacterium]